MSLKHEQPLKFVESFWQKEDKPNYWYLAYRWFLVLFFVISLLFSFITFEHHAKWFIFITNWSFTLCTATAITSAILVSIWTYEFVKGLDYVDQTKSITCYKLYWVMHVMATDVAFLVTTVFWLLYRDTSIRSILTNAFNSVAMFIDLCLVGFPVKYKHFYLFLIYACVYILFTAIYYVSGGTDITGERYIYSVLDWEDPGTTFFALVIILILGVFYHVVCYLIYLLKKWIRKIASCFPDQEEGTA